MASLPASVSYGKVVGRFLLAVGDNLSGVDGDAYPDGLPAQGYVTFNAAPDYVLNQSSGEWTTVYLDTIVCPLDANGYITDPAGQPGVWLVATDDPDNNPTGWTYTVTVTITNSPTLPKTFSIPVPSGSTTDITTVTPVDNSLGSAMVVGPPANITLGTVTTGPMGGLAAATLTGTAPDYTLSLTLPRGDAGLNQRVTSIQDAVGNSAGRWGKIGQMSLTSAFTAGTLSLRVIEGNQAHLKACDVTFHVKNGSDTNAAPANTFVTVHNLGNSASGTSGYTATDFKAVLTTTGAGTNVVELWVTTAINWENTVVYELARATSGSGISMAYAGSSTVATSWQAALPVGTQTTGIYPAVPAASIPDLSASYVNMTGTQTGILGNKTFTNSVAAGGLISTGGATIASGLTIAGAATNYIEIGRTDGTASTPFIDFHSGATLTDYDSRISATGGTGSNAGGGLTLAATGGITLTGSLLALGSINIGSSGTRWNNVFGTTGDFTNLTLSASGTVTNLTSEKISASAYSTPDTTSLNKWVKLASYTSTTASADLSIVYDFSTGGNSSPERGRFLVKFRNPATFNNPPSPLTITYIEGPTTYMANLRLVHTSQTATENTVELWWQAPANSARFLLYEAARGNNGTFTVTYFPNAAFQVAAPTGVSALISGTAGANASVLGVGTVPTARLGSGTADASTFLRGDNTWQTHGIHNAVNGPSGTSYIRIATLDGITNTQGANISGVIANSGNYGSLARSMLFFQVTQRGDNGISGQAWSLGNSASVGVLYTKQISTLVFEIWLVRSTFDASFGLRVFGSSSASSAVVSMDSQTSVDPGGLVALPNVSSLVSRADTDTLYQPIDSDLTSIAALTTTSFGRGLLTTADAAALRATAGLATVASTGSASDLSTGTLPDARLPGRLGTGATTITDWNNATANGFYFALSTATNAPTANSYLGKVEAQDGTNLTQTAVAIAAGPDSSNTRTYRRHRVAGTWGSWFKLSLSQAEQDAKYQPLDADLTAVAANQNIGGGSAVLAPVRVVTSGNITLSGTQTIDGVAVVAGDRVLVVAQTTTADNGVYIVAAGAWTRATDADTAAKITRGTSVVSLEGTINKHKTWFQTRSVTTLGTDIVEWRVFTVLDFRNGLAFPIPVNIGHAVANSSTRTIHVWDGAGWAGLHGVWVVTSTTRPSLPTAGNIVFETDTERTLVYDGAAWKTIGTGAGGGGGGAMGTWSAAATGFAAISTTSYVDIPGATVTVPVISTTDKYLVTATFAVNCSAAGAGNLIMRPVVDGVNGSYAQWAASATGTSDTFTVSYIVTDLPVGNRVFKLVAAKDAAGGNYNILGTASRIDVVRLTQNSVAPTYYETAGLGSGYTVNTGGTSFATVPGWSINFVSLGTDDVFEVVLTMDVEANVSEWLVASPIIDGAAPSPAQGQMIFSPQLATAGQYLRAPITKTYKVTGLSAGSHTLAVSASSQVSGSTPLINSTHSTLSIKRITGGVASGVWLDYTPTVTGMTMGASTVVGRYCRMGNTVHFSVRITLGAGFAFLGGNAPTVSLPVARSASALKSQAQCTLTDTGVNSVEALGLVGGTSSPFATAYIMLVSGGVAGSYGLITGSSPFTWAVGDFIDFAGTYECAP